MIDRYSSPINLRFKHVNRCKSDKFSTGTKKKVYCARIQQELSNCFQEQVSNIYIPRQDLVTASWYVKNRIIFSNHIYYKFNRAERITLSTKLGFAWHCMKKQIAGY